MTQPNDRPDPDALLSRIQSEEKKSDKGRLKIFFGSCAGVGKTYAMLSAAHEILRDGVDVVVGIVETHQRKETERLLEGLPLLPPLTISYRGVTVCEMDLDAALARKPGVILVDELAHTNAPGMRHPKRWNDVIELLDAGIDVYTTLNVQHIESLADIVAGSTGIWVRETVPDSVFDAADDIVLVDIDADDLLKRLLEGKVYIAPQAKTRAAENFFRKSNLIALRELALRRTAERVDAEMDVFFDTGGAEGRLPVTEKLLVCVGADSFSAKLVRTTKRMASAIKAPWAAVYVEDVRHQLLNEQGRRALDALDRMIARIGGKLIVLQGDDSATEIIDYARKNKYTKIIVGKKIVPRWMGLLSSVQLVDRIIHQSGAIDVYVVTDSEQQKEKLYNNDLLADYNPVFYGLALCLLAFTTLIGFLARPYLRLADQTILLLVTVVFIATRFGRGPSLLAALLGALGLNFFFVEPYYQLGFADFGTIVTCALMLAGGAVVADQVARMRLQTLTARGRERYTQSLYRLTRELTSTRGRVNVSNVVTRYIADMLDVDTTVWLSGAEGRPVCIAGALPEGTFTKEMGVLQWCFDNAQIAGRDTTTMPSARGLYFPLVTSTGPLGVVGIFPKNADRSLTLNDISTVETMVSLLATALERVRTGEAAEQARVQAESEKLRAELQRARDAIMAAAAPPKSGDQQAPSPPSTSQ